jgi:hypothetical protein
MAGGSGFTWSFGPEDADRAQAFWGGLFGWKFGNSGVPEMDYRMRRVARAQGRRCSSPRTAAGNQEWGDWYNPRRLPPPKPPPKTRGGSRRGMAGSRGSCGRLGLRLVWRDSIDPTWELREALGQTTTCARPCVSSPICS